MPTIHISSPVEIELDAVMSGVAQLDTPSLERFAAQVNTLLARRKTPHLTRRETELLQRINQEPPVDQKRYRQLDDKRRAETLTPAEHQELLDLIAVNEQADGERLRCLVELAQLRGVGFDELLSSLGIAPPAPVYG
jgi:hypothetical protein